MINACSASLAHTSTIISRSSVQMEGCAINKWVRFLAEGRTLVNENCKMYDQVCKVSLSNIDDVCVAPLRAVIEIVFLTNLFYLEVCFRH